MSGSSRGNAEDEPTAYRTRGSRRPYASRPGPESPPEPAAPSRSSSEGVIPPEEHWLLAGTPHELLKPLLDAGREERYPPGQAIFREADASDGLYLILGGSVRVSAVNDTGDTFIGNVRANEVVGEMGVLDGEPRSGTAITMSVCAAYFLPTEPFLDLLEVSTVVCMRLLALLAQRLRATNARLNDLPAGPITLSEETLSP